MVFNGKEYKSLIANIKPNSVHDKNKFSKTTIEKWISKFESNFGETVLFNIIKKVDDRFSNPLMCSSPMGCTYYGLDVFLNDRIVLRYNSDYTTHDITEIKKRALSGGSWY